MSESPDTPGQRLRRAREHQGTSVQKAADEMRLDSWVIEAIESDDFDRLGPSVYARGHLKKYAGLLGIPAAEIMLDYESVRQAPAESNSRPTGIREPGPHRRLAELPWRQIAALGVLGLLVAGLIWWRPWAQRSGSASLSHSRSAVTSTEDRRDKGAPQTAVPSGAARGAAADHAGASSPAAAGATEAGAGHARLRMSFSADSWVEIRDAEGKTVFAGNGRANSVKTIAGSAPLRVYLGFANGVQLEINERAVPIGPQFVQGDAARFDAGADGVLRRESRGPRPRG
jgi:cytoskeleton protein RodZ